MADSKLLQHVYAQLRDAAHKWAKDHLMRVEYEVFNLAHENENGRPNFWIRLKRPAGVIRAHFQAAVEGFLQRCEHEGLIGDLVPVKITVKPYFSHYDIEGEDIRVGESTEEAQNKASTRLLVAYNKALIDAIRRAPDAVDGSFAVPPGWQDPDTPEQIEARIASPSDERRAVLMNRLSLIVQDICGPLDPVQAKIEDFGNAFVDIHLSIPKLNEARGDLITAYGSAIIDAVNNENALKKVMHAKTWEVNPTYVEVRINTTVASHRDRAMKKLRSIVQDICGPMSPVQAEIEDNGLIVDIGLSLPKLNEARGDLLAAMAQEIVSGFRLAEESVYEDNGLQSPYSMKVLTTGDRCSIELRWNTAKSDVGFDLVRHRLREYINEYIDGHMIKPKMDLTRGLGVYVVSMSLDLKEELSPNAFASKIAEKMADMFRAEVKAKAANSATFELDHFSNGVPYVRARLANRSALTRAAVERIMSDICDRELPEGNLLRIEPRFGGFGSGSSTQTCLVAFKPV